MTSESVNALTFADDDKPFPVPSRPLLSDASGQIIQRVGVALSTEKLLIRISQSIRL